MFKKLYRAIAIARTRSAANDLVSNMTDRQLDDIGLNRYNARSKMVEALKSDFAKQDLQSKQVRDAKTPNFLSAANLLNLTLLKRASA